MKRFLISVYAFADNKALSRRMASRSGSAHLENIKILKDPDSFTKAGTYLNQEGEMAGYAMMVQFESRALEEETLHTSIIMGGYLK